MWIKFVESGVDHKLMATAFFGYHHVGGLYIFAYVLFITIFLRFCDSITQTEAGRQ